MHDPLFHSASGYQGDALALPVVDLDVAAGWYAKAFGLTEVERRDEPVATLVMERDGVRLGFAINGGDASNDGAAIRVHDVERARREFEAAGASPGEFRVDDHDGVAHKVFFVVAPDGLCFYVHQPLAG